MGRPRIGGRQIGPSWRVLSGRACFASSRELLAAIQISQMDKPYPLFQSSRCVFFGRDALRGHVIGSHRLRCHDARSGGHHWEEGKIGPLLASGRRRSFGSQSYAKKFKRRSLLSFLSLAAACMPRRLTLITITYTRTDTASAHGRASRLVSPRATMP